MLYVFIAYGLDIGALATEVVVMGIGAGARDISDSMSPRV